MKSMKLEVGLTAVFEPAREGGFTCFFQELPDVFSQGETIEEARANLQDALQEVLAFHRAEALAQSSGDAIRETVHLVTV